jgi:hypothetical protein
MEPEPSWLLPSWPGMFGALIVGELGVVVCASVRVSFPALASRACSLPTAAKPLAGPAQDNS